jgi:hypothetical protein
MNQPAPYTRETLNDIRSRARQGVPDATLAEQLGWPPQRLRSVCSYHGIELVPAPIPSIMSQAESDAKKSLGKLRAQARKLREPGQFERMHGRICGDDDSEIIYSIRMTEACERALVLQAGAFGLSRSGLTALILEAITRQDIIPLILDAHATDAPRSAPSSSSALRSPVVTAPRNAKAVVALDRKRALEGRA